MNYNYGHWVAGFKFKPEDYLGFIYKITFESGEYYYGRKQFWNTRRGKRTTATPWGKYTSTSNNVHKLLSSNGGGNTEFRIIACFTSKSAIRYAETYLILGSGAYEDSDRGLNWSFEGGKGILKLGDKDTTNLKRLKAESNKQRLATSRRG